MIRGKNIILRLTRRDDLPEIHRLMENLETRGEFWPLGIRSLSKLSQDFDSDGFWAQDHGFLQITDLDGRLIGNIGFFQGTPGGEWFETGYRIYRPEDRGKGYMTEALRMFSAYIFTLKHFPRLQLCAHPDNAGSCRVAEKCGFTREGILRKSFFLHGEWHDTVVYSMLAEEAAAWADVIPDGEVQS